MLKGQIGVPFIGVGRVVGVVCQFDDGPISLNIRVERVRLVNFTKSAGRGKMVCGVDILVSEKMTQ